MEKDLKRLLVGYGGSISYGLNTQDSDIDIRGIILNPISQVIGLDKDFEQIEYKTSDTVLYSLTKALRLMLAGNTGLVELLGLNPEHYIEISDVGQIILDNRHNILSQNIISKFDGFISWETLELERMQVVYNNSTNIKDKLLKDSLDRSLAEFNSTHHNGMNVQLEVRDGELYITGSLEDLKLTEFKTCMSSTLGNVLNEYRKMNFNKPGASVKKMAKKMCQIVRLYNMGYDLNTTGEVKTFRDKDHDLLMDLKSGVYLDDTHKIRSEYFDIVEEAKKKWKYSCENSVLPEKPNMKVLNELIMTIYGVEEK